MQNRMSLWKSLVLLVNAMTRFFLFSTVAIMSLLIASCAKSKPDSAFKKESRKQTRATTSVRLEQQSNGCWQLLRGDQPYYVNGAGGQGSLKLLAQCGGNSMRTWGVGDDTQKLLDAAQAEGLTVAFGIWLEHERHGFDYNSFDQVSKQVDEALEAVRNFKSHPAILVWGIGNEMEGYQSGDNPAIWLQVEYIAGQIKKLDPDRPTMTVIADVGGNKVRAINKFCPSIDIIGINSYGGVMSIPKRYREAGGSKPYIVTEFGPQGTWEVEKNGIGCYDEPTSTEKAKTYKSAFDTLKTDRELCLGSYAFLWGNKQEATATWFGMLLPDGCKTAAVDAMTEAWTGQKTNNGCPEVESLGLIGPNEVEKGSSVKVNLKTRDPEGDKLKVEWVLMAEPGNYVTGGDFQPDPKKFPDSIVSSDANGAEIKMPNEPGIYRVYAYVRDGNNGAAVANVPLRIKGKPIAVEGRKTSMPIFVYDEPRDNAPYVPSGFMGEIRSITLDTTCTDSPKNGEHCLKCSFSNTKSWGGVAWQNPENDWGEKPGGLDLTGARKLTFWVRGAAGGESVKFGFGLLGRDKKFFDTAKKEISLNLTDQWKQHTIDLSDCDLKRIKTGFFWSLESKGKPISFFLDDIKFQ